MKRLQTLLIFQLMVLSLFAQNNSWQKVLMNVDDFELFDVKEDKDGNYLLATTAKRKNHWTKSYSLLYRIGKSGVDIDSVKLQDSLRSVYYSSLIPLENSEFLAIGASYDSLANIEVKLIIQSFTNSFEQLWIKTFSVPQELRFPAIKSRIDNGAGYLIFGEIYLPDNRFTPFIAQFDTNFLMTNWKLPSPNMFGTYRDVKKLNDSTFWALRLAPWRFERLDPAFNILTYYYLPTYGYGDISVKWLNNSTFIYLTKYVHQQTSGTSILHNLGLVRQNDPFDTTGSLFVPWRVSDTVDHQAAFRGIDFIHPDTIFAGGTRNLNVQNPYFASQPTWFIVYQTDSLFNLRWERFYGGDACYVMTNLLATSDGGCLIGGSRYDYLNASEQKRDIVILKLDKHGLITNLPERATNLQIRESLVYPNPGGDVMHIRIAVQHAVARLMLFDTNGRQVLEQALQGTEHTINTSMLQNGTYLYKLTSPTGLNESGKWIKH